MQHRTKALVLHHQVKPYTGNRLPWAPEHRNSPADQLLADSQALSSALNGANAEAMARVDRKVNAFMGLMVAIAVGVAGAFALIHFGTPCEGASLCMATVVPTQRSWLQRLVLDLQSWRLRLQIRAAQQDLAYQHEALDIARWECQHLPRQMAVTRAHIDRLANQIDALEAPTVR